MKWLVAILFAFSFNLGMAQDNGEVCTKQADGSVRVEGVDPFGAKVTVVYNSDLEKVYQERILDEETTFARFDKGTVVEYGTIFKPLAENVED